MKLYLDAGHGGNDPGACANGLKEKDLTLEAALEIGKRLEAAGVQVVYSRKIDVNAGEVFSRGKKAAGCDYFLSLHFNAGGGIGSEIYCNCRETIGATEAKLRDAIMPYVGHRKIASRRYDNGAFVPRTVGSTAPHRFAETINAQDYYGVLRGCWAAGVSGDLLEIAFIDNTKNLNAYLDNKAKVWDSIASAICAAFKITAAPVQPEPVPSGTQLFTLTTSPASTGDIKNLKAQCTALGLKTTIMEV